MAIQSENSIYPSIEQLSICGQNIAPSAVKAEGILNQSGKRAGRKKIPRIAPQLGIC
jgi:hypothetical protein